MLRELTTADAAAILDVYNPGDGDATRDLSAARLHPAASA
jgi:hypothetical protein